MPGQRLSSHYLEVGMTDVASLTAKVAELKKEIIARYPEPVGKSDRCPTGACPVPLDSTRRNFIFYKKGGRQSRMRMLKLLDRMLDALAALGTTVSRVIPSEGVSAPKKRKGKKKS